MKSNYRKLAKHIIVREVPTSILPLVMSLSLLA